MGGHSAWRKRVKAGELAMQGGGAICRHRPHLGRKGKEGLLLNRKGPTCADGGPNKKKKRRQKDCDNGGSETVISEQDAICRSRNLKILVVVLLLIVMLFISFIFTSKTKER